MGNLFSLTSQITEDKVINRTERIYADALYLGLTGNLYPLATTSKAPRQKIKFFLDAVTYTIEGEKFIYRIGEYVELEHLEKAQFITERGFFWLNYECTENDGNGNFNWKITSNDANWNECYISQVVFQDSFFNSALGWLNPDNPDNILSILQTQKLPGVRRMDLTYGHIDYLLVVTRWNECYKVYEDDFLLVGWFANAAANRIFFIIPKGIYAIKDEEFPGDIPTVNNPLHHRKTGALIHSTGSTIIRPATIRELWPTVIADIVPGTAAGGEGMELPLDTLCFSPNITVNAYHNATMFWDAVDGYTYGIRVDFLQNGATTGAINYSINIQYLGRNVTGKSPVPEAGV